MLLDLQGSNLETNRLLLRKGIVHSGFVLKDVYTPTGPTISGSRTASGPCSATNYQSGVPRWDIKKERGFTSSRSYLY